MLITQFFTASQMNLAKKLVTLAAQQMLQKLLFLYQTQFFGTSTTHTFTQLLHYYNAEMKHVMKLAHV
jgi:ABC-type branched-subunit amino acid transport system substrate-binding protein